MKNTLNILMLLVLTIVSFGGDKALAMLSSNQDADGNFTPLTKDEGKFFYRPVNSKLTNLKHKIRKIKGRKFQILITGELEAEIRSGTPSSVAIDFYDAKNNYSHTDNVKGTQVTLQVNIKEHDTVSENDVVLTGYQKVALPFVKAVQRMLSKNTIYRGKFKLLYEVSFAKIEAQLGKFDTAKLMVEVVVPERTSEEKESTEAEHVFTDSDGYKDGKENNKFFKGLEE